MLSAYIWRESIRRCHPSASSLWGTASRWQTYIVAELALFCDEKPWAPDLEKRGLKPILNPSVDAKFPRAMAHFTRLSRHPAFAPDVVPYLEKIEAKRAQ
jgi:hypothetical protein